MKYDVGELKARRSGTRLTTQSLSCARLAMCQDLLAGAKRDTDHVKRIVLACERDMEDRVEL